MTRLLAMLILCCAAMLALPALAATPVKVTSDTFEVDDVARTATFTGNVVIERGDLRVTCDKVVVRYGPGGVSDIVSLDATGRVTVRAGAQTATGALATYSPSTQILTMRGDVSYTSAAGNVAAPELVIDLKSNTTVFSSPRGGGGRVTGVFTPQ